MIGILQETEVAERRIDGFYSERVCAYCSVFEILIAAPKPIHKWWVRKNREALLLLHRRILDLTKPLVQAGRQCDLLYVGLYTAAENKRLNLLIYRAYKSKRDEKTNSCMCIL